MRGRRGLRRPIRRWSRRSCRPGMRRQPGRVPGVGLRPDVSPPRGPRCRRPEPGPDRRDRARVRRAGSARPRTDDRRAAARLDGQDACPDRAAAMASGEWLWFLDADTLHAPESLSIVMEYARRHDAALVSLLPELRCETFWERVVQPLGGIVLMQSFPLQIVHRDRSPLAFANGQYILIRRPAYDAAGGHEAVKDRFVEDIAPGRTGQAERVPPPRRPDRGDRHLPHVRLARPARAGLEPDPLRRPRPTRASGCSCGCST